MNKETSAELVSYLRHPNRWFRQTALRVLSDRKDVAILPKLSSLLQSDQEQLSLECLWAIYQIGGLEKVIELDPLSHANPQVRKWAFRLICDERTLPKTVQDKVSGFIAREKNVETRTQIASSAKRLPAPICLQIVQGLIQHESDTSDPYQPLLIWWALESKCDNPDDVLRFISSTPGFWKNRIVADHLATRLAKRFTMPGTRRDFLALARILNMAKAANAPLARKMLAEIEATTKNLANLVFPQELLTAITELGGASLELQVRQNDMKSIREALRILGDAKADPVQNEKLVRALGDIRAKESIEAMFALLESSKSSQLKIACLESLQKFEESSVGHQIIKLVPKLNDDEFATAESVLVSRKSWSLLLINAIEAKMVDKDRLADSTPRRLLFHDAPSIKKLVAKHFGKIKGATDQALRTKMDGFYKELQAGKGSPYEGKKLFGKHCAKCHRLYQNGGDIGPNLTAYQRNDVKRMLLHIVNPNAEIREGFENFMFSLDDGRIISGFVKEQDNKQIVVRTAEGGDIRIEIDSIENRKAVPHSLMPTDLLDPLTAQQRRDLFAFLRSTQPLNN